MPPVDPDRVSALREQVAAIEKARDEKLAAAAAAVELRMLEEKVKLGELEAKHGLVGRDILPVFSPKTGAMVVVKTPEPVQFQKFQRKVIADKLDLPDVEELIRSCLVYPAKSDFQVICDEAPGMLSSVVNAVTALNGAAESDAASK